MQWLDELELEDMYDIVPARSIVPSEGTDILDLKVGDFCKATFASNLCTTPRSSLLVRFTLIQLANFCGHP